MYQVIIVDDEPRILEGIIHLFPWNNFGFEVVASFTNGKEALEYINAHPQVDVVMTDIQMPVMTGIELSQKLKNEDIIVVFFSAYQDFEYARAAIINHVTDYLIKPMKYDAMSACFERIRKTLDKREKGHYLPYEVNADEADYVAIVKNYIIGRGCFSGTLLTGLSFFRFQSGYRCQLLPLSATGTDGAGHADAVGSICQILRNCRCRRISEPQKSHP